MTKSKRRFLRGANKPFILPALVAGGVAASPAGAIELGDMQVQSYLGQPLRASIAYALGPNEQLAAYCVSLSSADSSLPGVGSTRVDISNGVITLSGSSAIREPVISARLTVNCPYTPHLAREYTLLIDPVEFRDSAPVVAAPPAAAAAARPVSRAPAPRARDLSAIAPSPIAPSPIAPSPIAQGSRYQVKPGDSLSEIAQRIEGRRVGLWPAVDELFRANPDAFLDADPNRLKAGSWLVIPASVGSDVLARTAANAASERASSPAVPAPADVAPTSSSASGDAGSETPQPAVQNGTVPAAQDSLATDAGTQPSADDSADAVNPYVEALGPADVSEAEPATSTTVIADTRIEAPQPEADSPNRSVARIQTPPAGGTNWLPYAAGGGVGLIVLLLLFGRRLRARFGSTPVGAVVDVPRRRERDLEPSSEIEVREIRDLADDSPTDRNLALDAELGIDSDFDGEIDVDLAGDFGFSGTTRLDLELPESEDGETDIIAAPRADTSSILESEVLPDDDDYDMSVIMDVTRMPSPDEITEKDLKAIEIAAEEALDASYTLNEEADFDMLEKDYQDELSATQALNIEIEKAAKELVDRLESDDDATTNVQIGDVQEIDVTAELSAQNDELLSDLDDTNVNEQLELKDSTTIIDGTGKTAKLPREDKTVELRGRRSTDDTESLDVMTSDGDHTVEIITRDDDTVEMEIEGGRVDTARRRR